MLRLSDRRFASACVSLKVRQIIERDGIMHNELNLFFYFFRRRRIVRLPGRRKHNSCLFLFIHSSNICARLPLSLLDDGIDVVAVLSFTAYLM